jgi:excisionase family DNA binding protein
MSMTRAEQARQASFRWPSQPPKAAVQEWMTTEEVCAATKFATSTIKKYVSNGLLPAYRGGTSQLLRFKPRDVDALFKRVNLKDAEDADVQ